MPADSPCKNRLKVLIVDDNFSVRNLLKELVLPFAVEEFVKTSVDIVPKGNWSVEYSVRLNNAGDFGLPETRVEAMYAPEMFGETPNAKVSVTP